MNTNTSKAQRVDAQRQASEPTSDIDYYTFRIIGPTPPGEPSPLPHQSELPHSPPRQPYEWIGSPQMGHNQALPQIPHEGHDLPPHMYEYPVHMNHWHIPPDSAFTNGRPIEESNKFPQMGHMDDPPPQIHNEGHDYPPHAYQYRDPVHMDHNPPRQAFTVGWQSQHQYEWNEFSQMGHIPPPQIPPHAYGYPAHMDDDPSPQTFTVGWQSQDQHIYSALEPALNHRQPSPTGSDRGLKHPGRSLTAPTLTSKKSIPQASSSRSKSRERSSRNLQPYQVSMQWKRSSYEAEAPESEHPHIPYTKTGLIPVPYRPQGILEPHRYSANDSMSNPHLPKKSTRRTASKRRGPPSPSHGNGSRERSPSNQLSLEGCGTGKSV